MNDFELVEGLRERARPEREASAPEGAALAGLQRSVGNQALGRLLGGTSGAVARSVLQRSGAEEEELLQGKHDPSLAQRESEIPEEELQAKHDPSLAQRAEEDEELQMKRDDLAQREGVPEVGLAGGPVSDGISSRIDAQRGGGSPLEASTRATMEEAFGTSLESVRVHTGSEAASISRSLSAKAFTTGTDVFFGAGQYAPGSSGSERLLAHELTHVVQQSSGAATSSGNGMTVGAADDPHEVEADAVADAIAQRVAEPTETEVG